MALSRLRILLSCAVGCIIASSLVVISPIVDEASAYTPHAVIQISGDSGFTADNGVTGGNGTEADPFVISGWDIDAGWDKGIEILNTNAHFVVTGCYVHNSGWYAVYLENADNGTLSDNNVTSNVLGVAASSCENLVVSNNTISASNYYGLILMVCNGTVVSNNAISDSKFFGMVINDCIGAVLRDNLFYDDGIEMWGTELAEFNSHDIDTSNMVNGWPIRYYVNQFGLVVDSVPVGELILANCSDIEVTGLDISGPEVAILGAYISGLTVADCQIVNAPYSMWVTEAEDIWIRNNSISDACNDHLYIVDPGYAIYIYMSDGILIESNEINNSDFGAFMGQVTDVTFRGNTVTFGSYATAFGVYSATDVLVEGNNLSEKDGSVTLVDSSNCTVVDNTMYSNNNEAFFASNVTGLAFEGNYLLDNGFSVRMEQVYDVLVSDNYVAGAGMYTNFGRCGIDVRTGVNITLSNNTVSEIPDGGILVQGVDGATLSRNTVSSNLNDGLLLLSSQDVRILNNSIESNGDDGMFESGGSGVLELKGNYIAYNIDSGVEISHAAEIVRNTISNNAWYGIGLSAPGSTVYHNNIIGNMIQAFQEDGEVNAWDNGYPEGGNYWSDYAGVDLLNGPAQDQLGSDGIGDTPRIVPIGRQDRYPLMEPFEWNRPPVAGFEVAPSVGDLSTVFEFNSSASWDYETPAASLLFRWDWDGDGTWDTGWSNESAASHQYSTPGDYTVRLEVMDGNNTTAEYSLQVEVLEVIPELPAMVAPVMAAALCLMMLAFASGMRRRTLKRSA